jgi:class 3 adenylate cyclase
VLRNDFKVTVGTLGQVYTYRVDGDAVTLLGQGDLHDESFDSMFAATTFDDFNKMLAVSAPSNSLMNSSLENLPTCSYRIRVYPSGEFRSKYKTSKPIIYTVIVVLAFGVTSLVFYAYEVIVRRVQLKVLDSAKRSEAIVSSLFPALVRDRLLGNGNTQSRSPFCFGFGAQAIGFHNPLVSHKARLKTYLLHPPSLDMLTESEPIADLFPNTTVLFADIAGFTAWSSEREPSQVFKLLESLYSEFDEVARELGVFKVETIGDCYVAVTGLPEKMKDHAVVMVEFAFRCLVRMRNLVSKLELILGPGTADLSIRVGLHSGPVTAGVLRGERARFQLFGDTVNVASRMQSTGDPHRVHISHETSQLLTEAGKEHWVTQRLEVVSVKGKGRLQTYWAKPLPLSTPHNDNISSPYHEDLSHDAPSRSDALDVTDPGVWGATSVDVALKWRSSALNKRERLVEWNAELLQGLLQKIAVKRSANPTPRTVKCMFADVTNGTSKIQFDRGH